MGYFMLEQGFKVYSFSYVVKLLFANASAFEIVKKHGTMF